MASPHTPKPWSAGADAASWVRSHTSYGCFEIRGPDRELIAIIPSSREIHEVIANLQLMVEAPNLLATLDEIRDKLVFLPEDVPCGGPGGELLDKLWELSNLAILRATVPGADCEEENASDNNN